MWAKKSYTVHAPVKVMQATCINEGFFQSLFLLSIIKLLSNGCSINTSGVSVNGVGGCVLVPFGDKLTCLQYMNLFFH